MALNLSLRNIVQDRLSLSPPFSVVRDVFGYHHGSTPNRTMSLSRQLELLEGLGIDINLIVVGWQNFTNNDFTEINYGIQIAREIYGNVDICIRRIRWPLISVADAGGYIAIGSGAEAHDLTDDWSGPDGNYLDVFVVRTMTRAAGWSSVNGPCSKDDAWEMTGCVVSLIGSADQTGIVFAHEMGHYLGASADEPGRHSGDPNNFLFPNVALGGTNSVITNFQGDEMKSHCYLEGIFSDI